MGSFFFSEKILTLIGQRTSFVRVHIKKLSTIRLQIVKGVLYKSTTLAQLSLGITHLNIIKYVKHS